MKKLILHSVFFPVISLKLTLLLVSFLIVQDSRARSNFKHAAASSSVSFSPDGTKLASGTADGTVLLWDTLYITSQMLPSDFDGDGTVGFGDFLLFVAQFGLSQGDAGYDSRYDLDRDGLIGFSDFLLFANAFSEERS